MVAEEEGDEPAWQCASLHDVLRTCLFPLLHSIDPAAAASAGSTCSEWRRAALAAQYGVQVPQVGFRWHAWLPLHPIARVTWQQSCVMCTMFKAVG
jgi:hypothetical protein